MGDTEAGGDGLLLWAYPLVCGKIKDKHKVGHGGYRGRIPVQWWRYLGVGEIHPSAVNCSNVYSPLLGRGQICANQVIHVIGAKFTDFNRALVRIADTQPPGHNPNKVPIQHQLPATRILCYL